MPDTPETPTADESTVDGAATDQAAESATATEGEAALGDAGKKALDAMKSKWKSAEAEKKAAADELAALKAQVEGRQAEHEAEKAAREVERAALAKADERILKAEVRAAAAGKLNDPQDALRFLDLSALEVGADGEVDGDAVASAIADLISSKPYLAAQGGKRFQGGADGGARNDATKAGQLSEQDVKRLSSEGRHDEIVKAKAEGRLADYLAS